MLTSKDEFSIRRPTKLFARCHANTCSCIRRIVKSLVPSQAEEELTVESIVDVVRVSCRSD